MKRSYHSFSYVFLLVIFVTISIVLGTILMQPEGEIYFVSDYQKNHTDSLFSLNLVFRDTLLLDLDRVSLPTSTSIIYSDRLIVPTRDGDFRVFVLPSLSQDSQMESALNTLHMQHHWTFSGKLFGISGQQYYAWDSSLKSWIPNDTYFPVSELPVVKQSSAHFPIAYEDEEYVVFFDCFGEFEGTVYFLNLKNKEITYGRSTCLNSVFKERGSYYVLSNLGHMTGFTQLKKIEDPGKLNAIMGYQIGEMYRDFALGHYTSNSHVQSLFSAIGGQFKWSFVQNSQRYFVNQKNEFIQIKDGGFIKVGQNTLSGAPFWGNYLAVEYSEYTLASHRMCNSELEFGLYLIHASTLMRINWTKTKGCFD